MTSRHFLGWSFPVLGLLVLGVLWAQEPPRGAQKQKQLEANSHERRLAEMEARIDQLTETVQSLRTRLKAPPGKTEINVFTLKQATAIGVAKSLRDLFPKKDGLTLRIAVEPTLNTVLVRGSREDLEMVEAVIGKLEAVAEKKSPK